MTDSTARLSVELSANIDKLLSKLKIASDATGVWADEAGHAAEKAQASIGGVDFTVNTTKAKAATLQLVALQSQLDVARAAGDKKTSAALQDQIVLLSKVRELRRAGLTEPQAQSGAAAQVAALAAAERTRERAREAAEAAERRPNVGKAIGATVDRTRLGVIEEGSAKIPIFAGAIEELGPIGVAAAGALFAVAEGAEHVRKAMEFAEEVQKTSNALGVSTSTLQAFDYAAKGSAVGIEQGRQALSEFSSVLGGFQAHVGDGKSAKFFNALGFSRDDAESVGDVGKALEVILDKLAKLPTEGERARFAKGLGLDALLPVLGEGAEGVESFLAKIREAQSVGAIISPEQIHAAAELNDKVEALDYLIGQHFKEVFIDLAPAIEGAASGFEKFSRILTGLATGAPDVVRGLDAIAGAAAAAAARAAGINVPKPQQQPDAFGALGSVLTHSFRPFVAALPGGQIALTAMDLLGAAGNVGRAQREKATPPPPAVINNPGKQLAFDKEPKAKKPKADRSEEIAKASDDAIDAAKKVTADAAKGEAAAQLALTTNLAARAKAEEDAANAARDEANDALARRVSDAKSDARTKKITQAAADEIERQAGLAKADNDRKATLQVDKIRRDLPIAQAQDDNRYQSELAGYNRKILDDQSELAGSYKERAAIAAKQLADDQKLELATFDADHAQEALDNPQRVATLRSALVNRQAGDSAVAKTNNLGPGGDAIKGIQDDLQDSTDKLKVDGLNDLNDNLLSVITHSKTAQDALHDLFLSIFADLAKMALQQGIELPLANALFPAAGAALGANDAQNNVGIFGFLGSIFGKGQGGGYTGPSDLVGPPSLPSDLISAVPLLSGVFAGGTDSAPGGMSLVGENGPEILNIPQGGQVYPNSTLRALAAVTPRVFGGSSAPTPLRVSIDLTGANGDQTIRDIAYQAAAAGSAHAISVSSAQAQRSARAARQDLSRF